eukprot:1174496-Rhodomonas_salina.2
MNPVAGTDMAGRRGELQMMTVVEVAARLGDTAKSKTYNRIPGAGCTEAILRPVSRGAWYGPCERSVEPPCALQQINSTKTASAEMTTG